jgi:hypothetical protein
MASTVTADGNRAPPPLSVIRYQPKEIIMKKTLVSTFIAGVFAAGSMGSAQALTFYFDAYGGWVDGSASTNPFPDPIYSGQDIVGDGSVWSDLSWGTPQTTNGPYGGQSGARINEPGTYGAFAVDADYHVRDDVVVSSSDWQLLGLLKHYNEPIDEWWEASGDVSAGMTENFATANVRYFFDVYASEADRDAGTNRIAQLTSEPFGDFLLAFQETHNDGTCPAPNPIGSNCDDIFTFGPVGATDIFSYLGETYQVTLSGFWTGPDFTTLSGAFYSGEGENSIGFVGVVTHVPEPASIALLGLGLLGLGASRRWRQTKEVV